MKNQTALDAWNDMDDALLKEAEPADLREKEAPAEMAVTPKKGRGTHVDALRVAGFSLAAAAVLVTIGLLTFKAIKPNRATDGEVGKATGSTQDENMPDIATEGCTFIDASKCVNNQITKLGGRLTQEKIQELLLTGEAQNFMNIISPKQEKSGGNKEDIETAEVSTLAVGSTVEATDAPTGELTFSAGFGHLCLGLTENIMEQYTKDVLVYHDGKIVGQLTILPAHGAYDGEFTMHQSWGGKWYDSFRTFLEAHRGEELVFVYNGIIDAVITPDNEVFSPEGNDISEAFPEGPDYYNAFKCEDNTLIP